MSQETKVPKKRVGMAVTQLDDGTCEVFEQDLTKKGHPRRRVAVFPEETRMVPVKGKYGPELAKRDVAQIRAMVFATMFEKLVNEGKVDLG